MKTKISQSNLLIQNPKHADNRADPWVQRENAKFTRELNTYGFDDKGIGDELLFPIRLNEPSGGDQETNLATYLVKYKEFRKTCVKIQRDADKEGFNS